MSRRASADTPRVTPVPAAVRAALVAALLVVAIGLGGAVATDDDLVDPPAPAAAPQGDAVRAAPEGIPTPPSGHDDDGGSGRGHAVPNPMIAT